MEIGYKRAERMGRTYSEYGDEPAQPSEAGCALLACFHAAIHSEMPMSKKICYSDIRCH